MIIYFLIFNVFCFFICFLDKRNAIYSKTRFSEKLLLLFCFLGGCFGFYFGMIIFHHKTRKLKFKIVPFICILYLLILIWS